MSDNGVMRRHLRRFAWLHLAVAGLFFAAVGAPIGLTMGGGVAGTATVASCEPADPFEGQTTPRWACVGTFVSKDGTPHPGYVWFEVARDLSPAPADQVDIVVGAEWWRHNHGVERQEQIVVGVVGLLMMAGGITVPVLIVHYRWRRLPPGGKLAGVGRFLAWVPVLLAPSLLVAAAASAVAAASGHSWRFTGIFTFALCSALAPTILIGMDDDPSPTSRPTRSGVRRGRTDPVGTSFPARIA
jgi:hypothetical protein